jgi:hypothetical protein
MQITNDLKKAVRDIIRLAPYTVITRHTTGKVLLKYSMWGLTAARDIDFDALVHHIPGLLDARVKLLSRSIVIDYDPKLIPGDIWEDLDRIKKKPELAAGVAERLQGLLAQDKTG